MVDSASRAEISTPDPQPPSPVAIQPLTASCDDGARHAALFLDMLAAERGASKNTLDAYRRDLDDYLAYLTEAGTAPDKADAPPPCGASWRASRSGA